MKRKAVTSESFIRNNNPKQRFAQKAMSPMGAGINSVKAHAGKIDKEKTRLAAMRSGDAWHTSGLTYNSAYRSSYANSGQAAGAFGDVPLYFALMNENNGGILYWPVNLKEKYEWYRYFHRCFYVHDTQALITCKNGEIKDIRDINIGDEIITALGTVKKVKEIFKRRAKGKAVKIKAMCLQNPAKVTSHHPYYILRQSYVMTEDGKYMDEIKFNPEWVNADKLNVGDYVLFPKEKNDSPSSLTPEQTRFLGYYAAEGSVMWGMRCATTVPDEDKKMANGWKWHQEKVKVPVGVSFTINKSEKDTLGKGILEYAKKVFNIDGRIARERDNHVEIVVNGREVGEFCFYHVGVYSEKKKLSQELVWSSKEAQKEFIVGYMGGDGHQYDNSTTNAGKIVIGTSSIDLASQVQFMAISSGVMCRYASYDRIEHREEWKSETKQIHISIPAWSANELVATSDKWDAIDKKTRQCGAFFIGDYAAHKIEELTYSEEDDTVYNLEIDAEGDEKSYICNGMITHNTDPFVGQAIDMHIDLPLSKLILKMPEMKDKALRLKIQKKYEKMCKRIKLFEKLPSILLEYHVIGNAFMFFEFDEKTKEWSKMIILPPEEVNVTRIPFTDYSKIEYNPEGTIEIVKKLKGSIVTFEDMEQLKPYCESAEEYELIKKIPFGLLKHIIENEMIIMDTDPYTGEGKNKVGSFVYHMARRKHEYFDLGASIIERVLVPLLMKEHYKYTQLSLASRNMTPRNKVSAAGIPPAELDLLREQVDLSMLDPDYSVVTNYDWNWEQIGADQRLIDLSREYDVIENQLFAGLGVTKELLTGEGMYSGSRITIEVMNTRYMMMRELLVNMIEENIFKPIAEENGFYEEDEDGFKNYFYPKVSFSRLTIRDNAEVFDSLFQLYQKGSLPVDVILELFNIDSDEVARKLKRDNFTVKDATYNDMLRRIYDSVADKVAEGTDIADRIMDYLTGPDGKPLKKKAAEGEQSAEGAVAEQLMSGEGAAEEPQAEEPQAEPQAEEQQSTLPSDVPQQPEESQLFTDEPIKVEQSKVIKVNLNDNKPISPLKVEQPKIIKVSLDDKVDANKTSNAKNKIFDAVKDIDPEKISQEELAKIYEG